MAAGVVTGVRGASGAASGPRGALAIGTSRSLRRYGDGADHSGLEVALLVAGEGEVAGHVQARAASVIPGRRSCEHRQPLRRS